MPEKVRPFAARYQKDLKLDTRYKAIPHPEDLHVTLYFIGSCDEDKITGLSAGLRDLARSHSPFTIEMDRVDFFGSPRGPRVVYLGFAENRPLQSLQKDVSGTVHVELGLSPSRDRFTPHVTIAKKKKTEEPLSLSPEPFDPCLITVDSFQLFEIHPARSPKYVALETFKLGG